jgi:hypothetical protein
MSIAKTLLGTSRNIAEVGETGWGSATTLTLTELIDVANAGGVQKLAAGGLVTVLTGTAQSLAASATLTPNGTVIELDSTGGAVTLDVTTPIANGEFDLQLLLLLGTDDTNSITIQEGSTTVILNGDITLTDQDAILLLWVGAVTEWFELARNK